MGFNVGDKVHVEFDAVVTAGADSSTGRLYTHTVKEVTDKPRHGGTVHYVYLHDSNATVVESDPVSWPPQIGDVWEAAGHEYFVYASLLGGATVFPFEGTATSLEFYSDDSYTDHNVDDFKALKPTLVRRREASIGGLISEALSRYSSGGRFA